jgi:hypothetical protein
MVRLLAVTTGSAKGQLGVEITTSANVIHRGDAFNVDIKIQNAFEQNVQVAGWSWQLPPGILAGKSPAEGEDITLRPGDSRAISIPIYSKRPFWAFGSRASPGIGTQLSGFNIKYRLEQDGEHWQNVPVTLNIHASPVEIYFAAFIGGIIGSLVNTLTFGLDTLVSGILGLFLVLISQRRADVQFGVSIEDALGGLVVGFLVGYLGTSYFKGFLPKP